MLLLAYFEAKAKLLCEFQTVINLQNETLMED